MIVVVPGPAWVRSPVVDIVPTSGFEFCHSATFVRSRSVSEKRGGSPGRPRPRRILDRPFDLPVEVVLAEELIQLGNGWGNTARAGLAPPPTSMSASRAAVVCSSPSATVGRRIDPVMRHGLHDDVSESTQC